MAHATDSSHMMNTVDETAVGAHNKPAITPLAYSIAATSQLFGISESKAWALIRDGKIRYIKLGRRTLITTQEIQRILESGC